MCHNSGFLQIAAKSSSGLATKSWRRRRQACASAATTRKISGQFHFRLPVGANGLRSVVDVTVQRHAVVVVLRVADQHADAMADAGAGDELW